MASRKRTIQPKVCRRRAFGRAGAAALLLLFAGSTADPARGGDSGWRGELATGAGYFDLDATSRLGSQTVLSAYRPLSSDTACFITGNTNQFDAGSQYGAAFGLFKAPTGPNSLTDRLGWSATYDSFTDSRLGSPYIGTFSGDLEWLFGGGGHAPIIGGARYARTVTGSTVDCLPQAVYQNGMSGGPFDFRGLNAVELYGRSTVGVAQLELGVGYLDGPHLTTYRAALAAPLSDRVGLRMQATGGDDDQWTGFAGLTFALSGRRAVQTVRSRDPLLDAPAGLALAASEERDGQTDGIQLAQLNSSDEHAGGILAVAATQPGPRFVSPGTCGCCSCALNSKFGSVVNHRLSTQENLLRQGADERRRNMIAVRRRPAPPGMPPVVVVEEGD
ncbi:hypothetical protein [Alienimonas chondri]|uniref:Porin n=1 Tax=Alienimonas chondri TaxID=2681879 RepID=A0ABX1VIT6_9PLAN|nr:hypothetical protein [Alienimonas chondri]NNJ27188.1 hypothetical protein [Alienimonas chondri]